MKKIAAAVGALSIAGLALAPLAVAEQAPITEGPHLLSWSNGQANVNVAYDCGPDCFSIGDPSSRWELRFHDGVWATADGIWTADGKTLVNSHGIPATLS